MGFNEHKQPFWDASSECYDPLADYYDTLRGIVGLPAPQFYQDPITDRTWSVLELGCGTGIITQALANRMLEQHAGLGGVRVVGIDCRTDKVIGPWDTKVIEIRLIDIEREHAPGLKQQSDSIKYTNDVLLG
jgi:SAM-dependent methyltransferase